jgi:hypothetical protein
MILLMILKAAASFAGWLGSMPQILGLTPRLYADVRYADSQNSFAATAVVR